MFGGGFGLMDTSLIHIIFYVSVALLMFCSGLIAGAHLMLRRNKKMFNKFRDEVLTKTRRSDIIKNIGAHEDNQNK
tara:strand:+ start:1107 stop:1334 length:228 start_codon:yes stop_codon:yes gene_type:complete